MWRVKCLVIVPSMFMYHCIVHSTRLDVLTVPFLSVYSTVRSVFFGLVDAMLSCPGSSLLRGMGHLLVKDTYIQIIYVACVS